MRIAAVGDLHFRKRGNEEVEAVLDAMAGEADLLLFAGDLTDTGLPEEMDALLAWVGRVRYPIVVAVLGNHDHENEKQDELAAMFSRKGVQLLDGGSFQFGDVGFAGIKGFCGGFGKHIVQPFGEKSIKHFVHAGVQEAVRLGSVLAQLNTRRKIVILHYSPIEATLAGEAREIYAFLGSSWLGDALDRYGVDCAVHGHAHNGSPEGRTRRNIPVYNVSRFVRARMGPKPYLLLEI